MVSGPANAPSRSGKISGSIAAIFSAIIARRAVRLSASSACVTAMRSATKRSRSMRADALLAVGRERGAVTRAIEHEVAHDAGVAQRDRETLADDRVVVAGGIADQHHAVGERRVGPRVVTGIRRARAGRRRGQTCSLHG